MWLSRMVHLCRLLSEYCLNKHLTFNQMLRKSCYCLCYTFLPTKSIKNGEETAVKDMTVWDINRQRGGTLISSDFEVSSGTALHWAAYYGKMEIVDQLFKQGASRSICCVVWVFNGTEHVHDLSLSLLG